MTRKEAVRQNHQEDVLRDLGFTREEAETLRRISMTRARKRLAAIIDRRNARITHPDSKDAELNIHAASYAKLAGKVTAFIQGDPRGAALYILRPGDVPDGADVSSYYNRGICVY